MKAYFDNGIPYLKIIPIVSMLIVFVSGTDAQTWNYLGLRGQSISAIAVAPSDSQIIYAGSATDFSTGKVGEIFKSSDGGMNWDTLLAWVSVGKIVVNPRSPDMVYVGAPINYVNGTAGILKTSDGGHTWVWADSGISLPPDAGITELVMDQEHPDTLYASTGGVFQGHIYKTMDGGAHWVSADTMSPWIWDVYNGDSVKIDPLAAGATAIAINPWDDRVVYAASEWVAYLLRSTDGGGTWTYAGLLDRTGLMSSIGFGTDSQEIFVCHDGHGLYSSNDGGASWKTGFDQSGCGTVQVERLFDNGETILNIFITSTPGDAVYQSTDYGTTWRNIGSSDGSLFLSGHRLYKGGASGGGIWITDDSLLTGIRSVGTRKSSDLQPFVLYQNFPNPFNPTTVISYQLPTTGFVSLNVYDILGRKVRILVSERQNSGRHSVTLDGGTLGSGVYFYQLSVGSHVLTRKFILLK